MRNALLCLICVLVALVSASPAQTPAFQVLPLPANGLRASGVALSDDGSLVAIQGKLLNTPSLGGLANADVPCVNDWSGSGITKRIPQIAAGPLGDRGFVHAAAGYAPNTHVTGFDSGAQQAFRYDRSLAQAVHLPPLPGDPQSTARGVNTQGIVVGRSGPGNLAGAQATVWTPAGSRTGLGFPAGADPTTDYTTAYDLSDDGSVVVGVYAQRTIVNVISGIPVYSASSWPFVHQGGTFTLLPNLPQDPNATAAPRDEGVAYAVSGDGSTVVGRSFTGTGRRAFRWTAANGVLDLGVLPSAGAPNSQAEALSFDGRIIVGWSQSNATGGQSAFVWDPINGMRRLDSVLAGQGVFLQGWELVSANGISADGVTITGTAENAAGDRRAYVAVLPREDAQRLEFGAGDPWSGGLPFVGTVEPPRIGAPLTLLFSNHPPLAPITYAVGVTLSPTPIDLSLLGYAAGATFYLDLAPPTLIGQVASDATGTATSFFFVIPPSPQLVGLSFHAQSVTVDTTLPGAPPAGVSRGTTLRISAF